VIRPGRLRKVGRQITRRQILTAMGASAGAAAISVNVAAQSDEAGPPMLSGVPLEPFVDPLPVPQLLVPVTANATSQHYRVTLSEFRQKMHRDLPPTMLLGI
jgi:hypothetical protein